ncbi:MAG: S-adenosylmethionine:tRNA ribosyltransferase-isomerase [Bacteroidales bacterium]
MIDIDLNEYDYGLPDEKIAQYPLAERDNSKLLIYDGRNISSAVFRDIGKYIGPGSLLVFNNTRVIRARLLFRKNSGATIEVLCLEPLAPADYESSFGSAGPVEWKCIIGNLKKWKTGSICLDFGKDNKQNRLFAERIRPEGDAWRIRFSWDSPEMSFSEVIEATGHIPLPPYINREDEPEDSVRYQTVYSSIKGSVAAPTAGLHFTRDTLDRLSESGISLTELTLHVGAGTFQPVRTDNISDHKMHSEHFFVTKDTIQKLIRYHGRLIAVGTTSVRSLESLYWIGIKALRQSFATDSCLSVGQWEPYESDRDPAVSAKDSLKAVYHLMTRNKWHALEASTRLIIIPGYQFRMTEGIITNFHQPGSTLLLLVAAWAGERWKEIYRYALDNNFRFLSYGDSSLLLR